MRRLAEKARALKTSQVVAALTLVGTIAGVLAAADNHWARASDVESIKNDVVDVRHSIDLQAKDILRKIEVESLVQQTVLLDMRRQALLDKMQDMMARPVKWPGDRAIMQRTESDLHLVEKQLRDKQRLIDQLRTQ